MKQMEQFIRNFKIFGLFGYKDINISFDNNVMIVIGENGFGKTTILNALTFTLQGEWRKLEMIKFHKIHIKFSKQAFDFTHESLSEFCEYLDQRKGDERADIIDLIRNRVGEDDYHKLIDLFSRNQIQEIENMVSRNRFLKSMPSNVLYNTLYTKLERDKYFSVFAKISNYVKKLGHDILYLPTYRRVEVDYETLRHSLRRIENPRYEEERRRSPIWNNAIIQFGMEDVLKEISNITNTISQSFITGYAEASGDMIRQLLKNDIHDKHALTCDQNQMKIVLARIGNNLSEEEKDQILKMVDSKSQELLDNTYLVYFLEQLLSIYKKQERYDSAIKDFCNVCNKYLQEKQFVYDESNVSLRIFRKINEQLIQNDENEVLLKHLSSGEKQIVSIFAHVYLNVDKRFIILLDEPELSLSIFWQENLIPDLIASNKCDFIMAVTHSPFIFGEGLKKYTVGINEFLENK